ncbi:group II intron maturase-specific domain-containing protein, partial [Cupriavidus necator]|uniref:group II intron maturase-specific domain-containing protein n=1 Tax=Cupriavidus necator TaxID=106590 RepID=UPI0039C162BE
MYHRHVVAKATFSTIDSHIWHLLWKWARRRHPTKGARWVRQRYYRRDGHRSATERPATWWSKFGGISTLDRLFLRSSTPFLALASLRLGHYRAGYAASWRYCPGQVQPTCLDSHCHVASRCRAARHRCHSSAPFHQNHADLCQGPRRPAAGDSTPPPASTPPACGESHPSEAADYNDSSHSPSTTVLKNKALFACLQVNYEESDGSLYGTVRGLRVFDGPVAWA